MPVSRDEWIIVDSHDFGLVAEGFTSEVAARLWLKCFPELSDNVSTVIMQARDWQGWDEPSSETNEYED